MIDGVNKLRIVDASAFDSVPGTLERGRRSTSNVVREGCSAARRTSIGPETDERAAVEPVDGSLS
jgi:hypothetical protein